MEGRLDEKDRATLQQQQVQQQSTEVADPEPDREFEKEEWLEWKLRQNEKVLNQQNEVLQGLALNTQNSAIREGFRILEDNYRKENTDYDAKKAYFIEKEVELKKIQQPSLPETQIRAQLDQMIIQKADEIYRNGGDPLAVIDQMATIYGYQVEEESEPETKKKSKGANLQNIKKNKAKSANLMSGSSHAKKGAPTDDDLAGMTVEDMMALTEEQWNTNI